MKNSQQIAREVMDRMLGDRLYRVFECRLCGEQVRVIGVIGEVNKPLCPTCKTNDMFFIKMHDPERPHG